MHDLEMIMDLSGAHGQHDETIPVITDGAVLGELYLSEDHDGADDQ